MLLTSSFNNEENFPYGLTQQTVQKNAIIGTKRGRKMRFYFPSRDILQLSKVPTKCEKVTVRLNSKHTHTHVVGNFKNSTTRQVIVERSLDLNPEDLNSDPSMTKVDRFNK